MTTDRLAGAWCQIKGMVKERWGQLTGDELKQIEGHADQLVGQLRKRYRLPLEEAERHGKEFRRRLNWG